MNTGTVNRVCVLDGARMTVDRGILVVGGTGDLELVCATYVIEHSRGLVLFDTGLDPEAIDAPRDTYGDLAIGLRFTADQRVDRQLELHGYSAADVTHVVLSHTHLDHTGGISLFPQAKFIAGEADLRYAYWPLPAGVGAFRTVDLDRARTFDWHPLHGDWDLFGDGSVQILSMPGHTPGNLAVLVHLADGALVLAGDTVHVPEAYTNELPMPSDHNTLESARSIRRLKQVALASEARVVIEHDVDDFAYLHARNG